MRHLIPAVWVWIGGTVLMLIGAAVVNYFDKKWMKELRRKRRRR